MARYFPSIRLDDLVQLLTDWRCNRKAIESLEQMVRRWQDRDGLTGLPIGPDASRFLANAFLNALDDAIVRTGAQHARWMDDVPVVGRSLSRCGEAIEAATEAIAPLGLQFSDEKSQRFEDRHEAIEFLSNRFLASLDHLASKDLRATTEETHRAFEMMATGPLEEIDPKRLKWVLRYLGNRDDGFAARHLADDPALANLLPQVTGSYLAKDRPLRAAGDRPLAELERSRDERYQGLHLHLLRAATGRRWGTAEGALFRSIALDTSRLAPLRSWAWKAWGCTDAWSDREAADAADAETDSMVRRAAVVPLRGNPSARRDRFLRHIECDDPDLKPTVRWLLAA